MGADLVHLVRRCSMKKPFYANFLVWRRAHEVTRIIVSLRKSLP